MTLTEDLAATLWHARAAALDGVAPHDRLQAAKSAAEDTRMIRSVPPVSITAPSIARRYGVGVEPVRRVVDAIAAADPSHGLAQALRIVAAKRREATARIAALVAHGPAVRL